MKLQHAIDALLAAADALDEVRPVARERIGPRTEVTAESLRAEAERISRVYRLAREMGYNEDEEE